MILLRGSSLEDGGQGFRMYHFYSFFPPESSLVVISTDSLT